MENIYVLNSEKIAESIEVTYKDKILSEIKFPTKYPLKLNQHAAFLQHIPYSEEMLEFNMNLISLKIEKGTPTTEKIAMFCRLYLKFKDIKYNMLPADKGKIKLIKINEELLTFYFTKSTAFEIVGKDGKGKHSVSNLMMYYNLLLQEMSTRSKSKYPDHWTEKYENSLLTQQQLTEYWAHLRSLGLTAKKNAVGKITDWVKLGSEKGKP